MAQEVTDLSFQKERENIFVLRTCPPSTCNDGESPEWRAWRNHPELFLKKSPLHKCLKRPWAFENNQCSNHPMVDFHLHKPALQATWVSGQLVGWICQIFFLQVRLMRFLVKSSFQMKRSQTRVIWLSKRMWMSSGKGRHSIVTVTRNLSHGSALDQVSLESCMSLMESRGFFFFPLRCLKFVSPNILATNNTECALSGGH